MNERSRSPFGEVLRVYRLQQGLSQDALAQRIVELGDRDPALIELGILSQKSIANLEAPKANPSGWTRPRPSTVRLLAAALAIPPNSLEETAFLRAADTTRKEAARPRRIPPQVHSPVAPPLAAESVDTSGFLREGREPHVRLLQTLANEALAGKPRFALLAGEAGVGKTWLITESCRMARQADPATVVAWGECTGGAAALEPYLPFRQALGRILGTNGVGADTVPAAVRKRRIRALNTLLEHAPGLVGTYIDDTVLSAHATALGIEDREWHDHLDGIRAQRDRSDVEGRFDQVAAFLEAIATQYPVVVVLEDLHWADERTCTLLLHLHRRSHRAEGTRLLILGSYRPSDLLPQPTENRHPLDRVINEMGRHVDRLVVDLATTVGPRPGRAFIDALLRDRLNIADPHIAAFLLRRTEGHPLFAVELLRWLQEHGGLTQGESGTWRLVEEVATDHTPNKVRAVIAERIARLPPEQHRALTIAAIQGPVFTVEIVARVLGLSADEADELFDRHLSQRHQFVSFAEPTMIAGKRLYSYRFTHALFQEYLSRRVQPRERERLHRDIANAMIGILGDEPHAGSAEIAYHLERAGEVEAAGIHALAAGRYAHRQIDYVQARHWFQRAILFAEEAKDLTTVGLGRVELATALRSLGRGKEAAEVATLALQEAEIAGLRSVAADSLSMLGVFAFDRGAHDKAAETLERALVQYRSWGDLRSASGIEAMISHSRYAQGRYDAALFHARSAFEAAMIVGASRYAAEALLAAANCEVDLGYYERALASYREASSLYQKDNDQRGVAICFLNTGLCFIQLGKSAEAPPALADGQRILEELRLSRLLAACELYTGLAHEALGEYAVAKAAYLSSHTRRLADGQEAFAIDSLAGLLRISTAQCDRERVRDELASIDAWMAAHGVEGIEDPPLVLLTCAHAAMVLDEQERAAGYVAHGTALLDERASQLADPDARHSYLTAVPANRTLRDWEPVSDEV